MGVAGDEIQEALEAMAAWIERRKLDGKWNLEIARIVARVQMGLWACAHDRPGSLVIRKLAEDVADLERAVAVAPFTKSIWRAGPSRPELVLRQRAAVAIEMRRRGASVAFTS
jgi:hypothetical protein